jgi:hypothetical protein
VVSPDAHAYALISLDDKAVWFLDLKSVRKGTNQVSFWMLNVLDPSSGKISYETLQYAVSCENQRIVTTYGVTYAVDGSLIASGDPHDSGAPIIPGSIGEAAFNYVCNNIDPFPSTGTIADTGLAVSAGHRLIDNSKASETTRQKPLPQKPKNETKPAQGKPPRGAI